MKSSLPIAVVVGLTASGAALASDRCRSPMADWQPREVVTTHVTELGIGIERLRIDDGCYEVRGRDRDGNRIELTLDPATLALLQLKIRFRAEANPARYLPGARKQVSQSERTNVGESTARPVSTVRSASTPRAEIN